MDYIQKTIDKPIIKVGEFQKCLYVYVITWSRPVISSNYFNYYLILRNYQF